MKFKRCKIIPFFVRLFLKVSGYKSTFIRLLKKVLILPELGTALVQGPLCSEQAFHGPGGET